MEENLEGKSEAPLRGKALTEEVRKLTKEGKSRNEIAEELNIHLSTISRKRKELGVKEGGSKVERWMEEHPEVKRAFSSLAPGNRRNYATYFRKYCNWAGKEPKELWEESWETIRDRIVDFRLYLEDKGFAPNTLHIYTSVIRRFYEYNNIFFKGKFFTNGKGKRAKEINEKELITPNKLKEILDKSDVSTMERAMFIMQLQSGLGAHELCYLKVKDIGELEEGKVKLRIEEGLIKLKLRREKTDVKFTTFIGYDGIAALERWVELRQSGKVMRDREISEGAKIKSNKDSLFVVYSKKYGTWSNIKPDIYAKYLRNNVRQLGWITDENMRETGQLNVFRPHALRMSFSEIMKHKAMVNWDLVEEMLGHRMSSTDSAYVKFDDEDLLKAYKQAEPFLSFTPIEPIITDDQYKELSFKNQALEDKIAGLEKREEARAPYDEKMSELMKRLIENPELKELIKKELKEVK